MKVVCIKEPNEFEILEQERVEIKYPDDVMVKIERVGICGSDLHIYHGSNPFATYPRIWGHEFVGEIIETGSKITDLSIGDHVVGEPFISCGICYACTHQRENVCANLQVYGVHLDGGCQEYMVMKRSKVHKVQSEIPWDVAVLAEPLTIGFQSVSRGRVEAGDTVLVMGSGTMGLSALIAAKARGAVVIMTDLFDEKLMYATKMGADHTINVIKKNIMKEIIDITCGVGPNVILDAVCTKSSLEQAVEMVSVAGRIVELGYGNIASEIPHVTLTKKEVDIAGTRLQTGKFQEAITYLEKNTDLLSDFVTVRFPVDQVKEAFQYVTDHGEDVRKALIVMG